ncbi:hypothetical protein BKA62DRAFT_49352 [Auriculariales sp. MPI-PUGE-AT-0066]|nr:hypothetical protein BKA62DRAFT_49352 [Auriculariales sp. MPI-PUGE-AT-0066]
MRTAPGFGLIAANVVNLVLLLLLFFTTYVRKIQQHPVVIVLLGLAIPRSIVAALPAFFFDELKYQLPFRLDSRFERAKEGYQNTWLARYCAGQGIAMYYFLTAQAFFAISFTVPMLLIAMRSPKLWKNREHVKLPSKYLLCAVPFIWALPVVVHAIPTIMHNRRTGYPSIYYTPMGYCTIDSRVYQTVSAILIGLPLLAGGIITILIFVFIARFYTRHRGVPRRSRAIDISVLLRFGLMLSIVFLNGIILLCEISLHDTRLVGIWRLDFYWTTLTPLMEVLIFGTQRVYLETWLGWAKALCRCCRRQKSTDAESAVTETATPDPPEQRAEQSRRTKPRPISTVSTEDNDNDRDEAPPIADDDDGLAWSSDEEASTPGGPSRRKTRKRKSTLFQWEPAQRKEGDFPPPAPPAIIIESTQQAGPSGPTRQDDVEHLDAPPPLDPAILDSSSSSSLPASSTPESSRFRSRSSPRRSPSNDSAVKRPADTLTPTELLRGYPLRSMQSALSENSRRRLIASPGSESDSPPSSEGEYGKPLSYMYGEMHSFLGMPPARSTGSRPRSQTRLRPISPAERYSNARRSSERSPRQSRQNSVTSHRGPVEFAWDQSLRPDSLSAVNETLAELPSPELVRAPGSRRMSASRRFANARAMWPPDGLTIPEHEQDLGDRERLEHVQHHDRIQQ